jgi:hypothetical protein
VDEQPAERRHRCLHGDVFAAHSRRGVFGSTRHTVAVDWTQAADPEFVRLFEEQAALRRVATLVARSTDGLG